MGGESVSALDPSLYPSSYRIPFWKGVLKFSWPLGIFAISQLGRRGVGRGAVLWFVVLLLILLTVAVCNDVFARVTLYPDRIERKTWFGKQTMLRSDVAGLVVRGSLKTPILTSKATGMPTLPLPTTVKTDMAWDAWMTVALNDAPGNATGL